MSPYSVIILGFYLSIALILQPSGIDAACNVCSDFEIACVNETSFNFCQNRIPQTGRTYTCPFNRQCSNTKAKCVLPKPDVTPTCTLNNRSCGLCNGTKLFACTSRTSFVQCDGVRATNVTGTCSRGLVCDSRGGELCKSACTRPPVLECERDTPL